jgi:hypothetical protein
MVRTLDPTLIHRAKMKRAGPVSTCVLKASRSSIFSSEYDPLLFKTIYWHLKLQIQPLRMSTCWCYYCLLEIYIGSKQLLSIYHGVLFQVTGEGNRVPEVLQAGIVRFHRTRNVKCPFLGSDSAPHG